ncbi:uncharacterized protein BP5553_09671 [Venustampulla echinocandica]|uniref:Zn(2)-C6 fungal-type domain-containing protein n=1 Tax=Venustampulla echinocandica TaxID=2656787 RepID=A0A370TBN6_9HELO|nr:uncharacterized protein BP5553_09671 [Venustampulla echinocandica]RDL31462.1 hypothetical protein BP5553_09671 [Venustampulla echinocandica]
MDNMESEAVDESNPIFDNASPPFLTSPITSPTPEKEASPAPSKPLSKRRGKKRSSRACASCRTRKVRCNIVAVGTPCSNCRHDEIECILPLSRRQRSARERAEKRMRQAMYAAQVREGRDPSLNIGSDVPGHDIEGPKPILSSLPPHWTNISGHLIPDAVPPQTITPTETERLPSPHPSSMAKFETQIQPPLATVAVRIPSTPKSPDQRLPILPQAFIPFPRNLSTPDLLYLHNRDALTLPGETLQTKLLNAYVNFVHGTMPILDLEQFISAVKYGNEAQSSQSLEIRERENTRPTQISLLLFQAVMFAGVINVPVKALQEAGYRNREAAKEIFFARAKLLYDFDTATDRLSIIQSLLLLTLYPTPTSLRTPDSHCVKDQNHYLNLAISVIYALALNRIPPLPSSTPSKPGINHHQQLRRRKLERRIFWAAFCRDRLLALSPHGFWMRPMQIKKEDCDIAMLSLADFDLRPEEEEVDDDMRARRDANTCVEKALMCWSSTDGVGYDMSSSEMMGQFPVTFSEVVHGTPAGQVSQWQNQPAHETDLAVANCHQNTNTPNHRFPIYSQCPTEYPEHAHLYDGGPPSSGTPSLHDHSHSDEEDSLHTPDSGCCDGDYGVCEDCDGFLRFLRPMDAEPADKVGADGTVTEAGGEAEVPHDEAEERDGDDRSTWAFQLDVDNDVVVQV